MRRISLRAIGLSPMLRSPVIVGNPRMGESGSRVSLPTRKAANNRSAYHNRAGPNLEHGTVQSDAINTPVRYTKHRHARYHLISSFPGPNVAEKNYNLVSGVGNGISNSDNASPRAHSNHI